MNAQHHLCTNPRKMARLLSAFTTRSWPLLPYATLTRSFVWTYIMPTRSSRNRFPLWALTQDTGKSNIKRATGSKHLSLHILGFTSPHACSLSYNALIVAITTSQTPILSTNLEVVRLTSLVTLSLLYDCTLILPWNNRWYTQVDNLIGMSATVKSLIRKAQLARDTITATVRCIHMLRETPTSSVLKRILAEVRSL